jgi:hypothetical protein
MKLREELQEEEVESRRRLAEADAQFAQLRRRLDDLLIEKEDLTEDRDQWIEWHTEEVSELRGAEQMLERHEDELHRAKGFVAASLANVGNAEREAVELMGLMALFQQASADDEVVVEQWALAQVSAVENLCSESLLHIEAEAERRHRHVMDDTAQTHTKTLRAVIAHERSAEAALAQTRDQLVLEEGSLATSP